MYTKGSARLAYLSQLTYLPNTVTIMESMGYSVNKIIESEGEKGFVSIKGDTIYIGWRGSDNFSDWVENAQIYRLRTDRWGWVYAGAYLGFRDVEDQARSAIQTIFNQYHHFQNETPKRVVHYGHSAGGCIARFLHEVCKEKNRESYCFTYGMPKIWADFGLKKHKGDDTHHRYTISGDVVPMLPSWIRGFRHDGKNHHMRMKDRGFWVSLFKPKKSHSAYTYFKEILRRK